MTHYHSIMKVFKVNFQTLQSEFEDFWIIRQWIISTVCHHTVKQSFDKEPAPARMVSSANVKGVSWKGLNTQWTGRYHQKNWWERDSRKSWRLRPIENTEKWRKGRSSVDGSPREIEKHTGLSRSTVRRIVKEDLNLQNFRRQKAQLLSESNREQRWQRARTLLRRFPPHTVRRIWFTDEKCFTVRNPINSQNGRVYAPNSIKKSEVPPEKLLRQQPHFTKKLMVSVGVSKLGKTRIVFIDEGAKVNAVYYTESVLENGLLPDIRRISGDRLQQDDARSHSARHTIQFLDQHVPAYIEPEHWPANSPDLNPVDYRIWGALQQRVY